MPSVPFVRRSPLPFSTINVFEVALSRAFFPDISKTFSVRIKCHVLPSPSSSPLRCPIENIFFRWHLATLLIHSFFHPVCLNRLRPHLRRFYAFYFRPKVHVSHAKVYTKDFFLVSESVYLRLSSVRFAIVILRCTFFLVRATNRERSYFRVSTTLLLVWRSH